jgi:hypothetical protein
MPYLHRELSQCVATITWFFANRPGPSPFLTVCDRVLGANPSVPQQSAATANLEASVDAPQLQAQRQ